MNSIAEDILMHYGILRRSGRYPWGSGGNPFQHSGDFLSKVNELRKEGLSETEIAKTLGFVDPKTGRTQTSKLRTQIGLANSERRSVLVDTAQSLRDNGYSLNEIAEKMGYNNDSSVRSLLNENSKARMNVALKTAEFLKERVDGNANGMIDVGVGVERELGLSREKMKEALYILEMEGYPTYGGGGPQVTNPGKQTNTMVLCKPGTEHKEIFPALKEEGTVGTVRDYISYDGGDTFNKSFIYPKSMDSGRVQIRYKEEGGEGKDGLIEIRRGVDDLSLGNSRYAQVRILVDDSRYMKGMAVYSDNMPDGVDVVFNTNKPAGTQKDKVFKPIKDDPDNPFGSLIKEHGGQSMYTDKDGKEHLSLINKTREEGEWGEWSDNLPSQFLSKQSKTLIKRQLGIAIEDKQAEFDDIMALNNPTVKKNLLKSFSDDCDAAAVHLQAAALPRQKYQVIMPIPSMKDTEVYAPRYDDGEQVALVRYPHGGTFEIPILTVNNKQREAKAVLGNASDAVGINKTVADRLSGADFDGDTVQVIPVGGKIKIASDPPLKGLDGFDPKMEYGGKEPGTFKPMRNTQTEMGKISNLITDMTLKGAPQEELARAVRHSMVVIDAEKHSLDYKASERDNGIAALKRRYQGRLDEDGRYREGAATLISRASSETSITKRQGSPRINTPGKEWYDPSKPEGSLIYKTVDEPEYIDKSGKTRQRTQASTQMADTDDAFTLISDANTPEERAYAEYANTMKSLANQARTAMVNTGNIKYDSSASHTYQTEVDSLTSKLNIALMNAPREREAQRIASAKVAAKRLDNPDMTQSEIKKAGQQALTAARAQVGASRELIKISDREWEAIQAGAISENTLSKILNNTDIEDLRQRATPRTTTSLSNGQINRLTNLNASGYTIAQIARSLGVSSNVITNYLKGKE